MAEEEGTLEHRSVPGKRAGQGRNAILGAIDRCSCFVLDNRGPNAYFGRALSKEFGSADAVVESPRGASAAPLGAEQMRSLEFLCHSVANSFFQRIFSAGNPLPNHSPWIRMPLIGLVLSALRCIFLEFELEFFGNFP